MNAPDPPRIWTLSDEHAGNFNQAQALAQAMGMIERHVPLHFPSPWRWLAPHAVLGALRYLALPSATQWPDIAIGCGRQAALALRALKRRHGRTFCVQILDPRIDPKNFDQVVTPAHDQLEGANVVRTLGALNAIDERWLKDARAAFLELSALPRPLTALLIGGPHRDAPLDEAGLESLIERLAKESGSLLICGSRRTPKPWRPLLRAHALQLGARLWMDADDGLNPYRGYLAHADRLVVTADSVNMLSEACATGAAVCSFNSGALAGKLLRFDTALRHSKRLSTLDQPDPPRSPLRETAEVAAQLLQNWSTSMAH